MTTIQEIRASLVPGKPLPPPHWFAMMWGRLRAEFIDPPQYFTRRLIAQPFIKTPAIVSKALKAKKRTDTPFYILEPSGGFKFVCGATRELYDRPGYTINKKNLADRHGDRLHIEQHWAWFVWWHAYNPDLIISETSASSVKKLLTLGPLL